MKWITHGLLALSGLNAKMLHAQDQIQVEADTITVVQAGPADPAIQPQVRVLRGDNLIVGAAVPSSYYLGLECEVIPAHYRKHLKLDRSTGGLLIRNVIKDSPAARANLQEGDLLLSIDGQAIDTIEQLVEKIKASQNNQLKIVFRREAEEQTVEVQPTKRPETIPDTGIGRAQTPQEAHSQWIEMMRKQGFHVQVPAPGTFDVLRPAPGIIMGSATLNKPNLPANTSVTIKHEGNKPAHIEVKQGDKSYTATSDKLDDLPAEVRALVEPMLQNSAAFSFSGNSGSNAFGQAGTNALPPIIQGELGKLQLPFQAPQIRIQPLPHAAAPLNPNLQQEMQDLRKQMEELQKQLQQLQK